MEEQFKKDLLRVTKIVQEIGFKLFDKEFSVKAYADQLRNGAVYLQVKYYDRCRDTHKIMVWHGRKWYTSPFAMDDEIIKTSFAALKAVVEHEIMEGFTYKETIVFNPHTSCEALMSVSKQEVRRSENEV